MKQVVIYARVSSDRQEKEGFSIPAQISYLKQYAAQNNFNVVKVFSESETAKKAGRKAFNEMLAYIKEKKINVILVEKTDRLYRNFKDYVTIDDIKGLEVHLVKDNTILSENSSSQTKFLHGIKVLMAKNYIDNLREEVNKGRAEKIKQGYYPHKAPAGYINTKDENGKKIIAVDETKAPFIRKLFELYASGVSGEECRKQLNAMGLYHNSKPYAKSILLKMLHDPFYIGKMEIKGVIYQGNHEPIIDIALWNKVQSMFTQSKARTHNVVFDYVGVIKCGHCGCQLTAELKKGKYIYYHCTGKRGGDCKKSYIRQEQIEQAIIRVLERIQIPEESADKIIAALKEMQGVKEHFDETSSESINKQIKILTHRIDALYADKLDGKITEEFWEEKHNQWHNEKVTLLNKLQSLSVASKNFYESSNLLLNWCKDAPAKFLGKSAETKRKILNLIGSNFIYKDGKLSIVLNPVFELILNSHFSKNGGTHRTMFEPYTFIAELKKVVNEELYVNLKLAA